MHYFLMIGHLGNVDSVHSTDLPNVDTLDYTIAKNSLISPLILSVKQIFFFYCMWQEVCNNEGYDLC